jgi:hypothetical protein
MSDDTTRLNIERAREALARARAGEVAAAVRAPRPADLSRLREEQERRANIDAQAGAFREAVRTRLGLGEYRGPGVPTTRYVGKAMSAPLCDADICAPPPHPALKSHAPESGAEADAPTEATRLNEAGDAYTPLPEGYVAAETPPPAAPPAKTKRRKFLGIF